MPKTNKECPADGTLVRFRVDVDTTLWHGKYTDKKGFEFCNGFICYTMAEVNYWQYEGAGK